jgi:hypothetical protein
MFNFIRVSFPEADSGPTAVYSAEIIQEKYKHDIIKIKFRDWDVSYDVLNPGSPVQVTITGVTEQKNIYGYIHHIKPDRTPGKNFTEMVVIGASYPFRQPSQKIYQDSPAGHIHFQDF